MDSQFFKTTQQVTKQSIDVQKQKVLPERKTDFYAVYNSRKFALQFFPL